MQVVEDIMTPPLFRLMQFALLAAASLHWSACLFYWSAAWNNFDSTTWVYEANLVPNPADDYASSKNAVR